MGGSMTVLGARGGARGDRVRLEGPWWVSCVGVKSRRKEYSDRCLYTPQPLVIRVGRVALTVGYCEAPQWMNQRAIWGKGGQ
jgi:hypothetical protein